MSWLDLTDAQESSYEPIPAGVYNLIVTQAEETTTKNNDSRIKLTFSVSDGDYAGRKIFDGYQLSGNETAVKIGRGQLKSLWRCAGHTDFNISSPSELLNIEIAASVKIKEDPSYGPKNVISTFKPKQATATTTAVPF